MENHDSEISNCEDETSSLFNNESVCDFEKKSDINDYDDDIVDTRSELKFDEGTFFKQIA